MKAFKGFKNDLTCRGFKYEVGETYEEENAELCNTGFHACENPIDCLRYYNPATSVYHEVELEEVSNEQDIDSKCVGRKITIGAEIGIPEICRLTFEYVKEHCTNANNVDAENQAMSGYSGVATAGDRGVATAGDYGVATAGYRGAATAGDYGVATAGCSGAATAGDYGVATSRGKSDTGKQGLSVVRGSNVRVKGGLGAVLVIVEENENDYSIKDFATAIVDGKDIKADTWYKIENGKLVEVDE